MGKAILFIAVSLDGYIAAEDGSLDWLFEVQGKGDNGFGEFYRTIDTILMGRKTYDQVVTMAGGFPHTDKKYYIISRTRGGSEFVNGDPAIFLRQLKKEACSRIWIAGGAQLLEALWGDLDDLIITIAPVVLGKGIPLGVQPGLKLQLKEARCYGQFVQLHYGL